MAQIPEVAWRGRTFEKAPTPSSVSQSADLAAEIFEGARGGSTAPCESVFQSQGTCGFPQPLQCRPRAGNFPPTMSQIMHQGSQRGIAQWPERLASRSERLGRCALRSPCACVFAPPRSGFGGAFVLNGSKPPAKPRAFGRQREGTKRPTRVVEKKQIWNFAHNAEQIRCSIVVSISACHAEDPGSIPAGGV